MSETQPQRTSHPVAVVLGKILFGRRPEDKEARKVARNVGLIATLVSLLSWMPWMLWRSDTRTDRMLADQREDLRAAVEATKELAEAVQAMALEARETRTTLLEKIPDATPTTRLAPVKPIPARRRP